MKLERLLFMKFLEAGIKTSMINLECYQIFEEATEIKLEINDDNSELKTMYFSGEIKNLILKTLIEEEMKRITEKKSKLQNFKKVCNKSKKQA